MMPLRAVGDAARLRHRDEELKVDQIETHGHCALLHTSGRHCERSEAIHLDVQRKKRMDCFVASLLAMTVRLRHERRLSPLSPDCAFSIDRSMCAHVRFPSHSDRLRLPDGG